MSLAMAAMRARSRQVQNQSVMKVTRLEKPHREDQVMLTVSENIKDFVRVICETLQRLCKKRRLASSDINVKADQICKQKAMPNYKTRSECNRVATATRASVIQKRIMSKPLPIPTRDRHGQRYPVYERKQFQYI